jgi:hypothetical protein
MAAAGRELLLDTWREVVAPPNTDLFGCQGAESSKPFYADCVFMNSRAAPRRVQHECTVGGGTSWRSLEGLGRAHFGRRHAILQLRRVLVYHVEYRRHAPWVIVLGLAIFQCDQPALEIDLRPCDREQLALRVPDHQ